MNNNKNNLAKLFRLNSCIMPKTDEEIEAFEIKFKKHYKKPNSWDNPLDILKEGKTRKIYLSLDHLPSYDNSSNFLAMAARDGKKISEEVRKRMREDRKNEQNK